MVGQTNEPTNVTDSNLHNRSFGQSQQLDDNGNKKEQGNERKHTIEENSEDVCSCSLAKDTNVKTFPSSFNNNNNGGSSLLKGLSGKVNFTTASSSPYIISLSTSRQHSNHHVIS